MYARAGALTAHIITLQALVTDRMVTIQFIPIVDDPFVSAIEVLELPNTTAPTNSPTMSPSARPSTNPTVATSSAVVRLNAGGETFVDSKGNTWSNDTYYYGDSFIGNRSCSKNIGNTIDDALFCTERYFRGNGTSPSSYEIPVNNDAVYQLNLYFSENVSKVAALFFVHF